MPEETERLPYSQADELLLTKQIPPRLHSSLIQRPDLFARLEDGVEKGLTLITAPTGFGKTTLVGQWLASRHRLGTRHGLSARNEPVQADQSGDEDAASIQAWITLDEGDNDPIRFWRYVISAIQQSRPETGRKALAMLRAAPIPSFEPLLTSLLNDLAHTTRPIFLVLDDFHLILAPEVIDTIQFLAEHMPPNLNLILLARNEPHLPLALLRARGEINELGADDLRFSEAETDAFLQRVLPFTHSPYLVQRLLEKTEGWAAGIRLITQAMRNQAPGAGLTGPGNEAYASRFIEMFRGEHRYVLEYLRREVFDKLPEPERGFILHTCFLTRLSGPLCDWIFQKVSAEDTRVEIGTGSSTGLLARLEQDSLFLTALGTSGCCAWYRYQALFAEAMRHEAQQILGEARIRSIHYKACRWYEQNGLLEEAIDSALAAEEPELALALIERFIEQRSFNEILILRHWCEQIPIERIHRHPLVAFNFAQALLFSSDRYAPATAGQVVPLLQSAEETWRARGYNKGVGQSLTVQGVVAWWQGDLKAGFQYTHQALAFIAESDVLWRGVALLALGNEAFLDGSLPESRNNLLEAQALSGAANNIHSVLAARNQLGDVAFQEGQLEQADLQYQQVLSQAVGGEEMLDDQSIAWLGLAQIAYEQNDLRTAEEQARHALELGTRRANEFVWAPAAVLLAGIAYQQGEVTRAGAELEALPPRIRQSFVLREVWAALIRLALSTGDLISARSWHSLMSAQPDSPYASQQAREALLAARLSIAEDQPDQALAQLKNCQTVARSQGRLRNEIEILNLQAQAYDSLGDRLQAVQALTVALTLGQPRGLRRIFLDEGRPLERLLPEIAAGQASRSTGLYATALLHAFSHPTDEPSDSHLTQQTARLHKGMPPNAMLVEPLSAQEIRVLRFIAAGRSNPEIAEELTVSVNTIKTQVQSIYRKLNVNSRQEARDAAKAFNLI